MTEDQNNIPPEEVESDQPPTIRPEDAMDDFTGNVSKDRGGEVSAESADDEPEDNATEDMSRRLERLGGEPAPVITPEEFARLQKAGQVHIDALGQVRTARRSNDDGGVSLRKRRAWY